MRHRLDERHKRHLARLGIALDSEHLEVEDAEYQQHYADWKITLPRAAHDILHMKVLGHAAWKQHAQAMAEKERVKAQTITHKHEHRHKFPLWVIGALVLLLGLLIVPRAHCQFSKISSIDLRNNDNSSQGFVAYPFTFKAGANCSWSPSGSTFTFNCTGAAGAAFDPATAANIYDDFASGDAGNSKYVGSLGWQSAGGTLTAPSSPAAGTYGLEQVATGAVSGNAADIYLYNGVHIINYAGVIFDTKIRVAISQTTTISFMCGMSSVSNDGEAAGDFIGVGYDTTVPDTNWMYVTRTGGGTINRVSSGTAANTSFHTFRIRSTVAGNILFSVDAGSETSVTTAVPTQQLSPYCGLFTRAASSVNLQIDYYWQNVNLSR